MGYPSILLWSCLLALCIASLKGMSNIVSSEKYKVGDTFRITCSNITVDDQRKQKPKNDLKEILLIRLYRNLNILAEFQPPKPGNMTTDINLDDDRYLYNFAGVYQLKKNDRNIKLGLTVKDSKCEDGGQFICMFLYTTKEGMFVTFRTKEVKCLDDGSNISNIASSSEKSLFLLSWNIFVWYILGQLTYIPPS